MSRGGIQLLLPALFLRGAIDPPISVDFRLTQTLTTNGEFMPYVSEQINMLPTYNIRVGWLYPC